MLIVKEQNSAGLNSSDRFRTPFFRPPFFRQLCRVDRRRTRSAIY